MRFVVITFVSLLLCTLESIQFLPGRGSEPRAGRIEAVYNIQHMQSKLLNLELLHFAVLDYSEPFKFCIHCS